MSKIVRKFSDGQIIPKNSTHIKSVYELDYLKSRYEWRPTEGFWGQIPIFGTQTLYKITPKILVHYYEVEVANEETTCR